MLSRINDAMFGTFLRVVEWLDERPNVKSALMVTLVVLFMAAIVWAQASGLLPSAHGFPR